MIKEKREKNISNSTTTTINNNNTPPSSTSSSQSASTLSPSIQSTTGQQSNNNIESGTVLSQPNSGDKENNNNSPLSNSSSSSSASNSAGNRDISLNNNNNGNDEIQNIDKNLDPSVIIKRESVNSPIGDGNGNNGSTANINNSSNSFNLKKEASSSGTKDLLSSGVDNSNDDQDVPQGNNSRNCNIIVKTEDAQLDLPSDGYIQLGVNSINRGGVPSSENSLNSNSINSSGNVNNNVNVHQNVQTNINHKQTSGMEYMQQQSQIFVFSTTLANKGAESVMNGQFPSIIAYHCSQPATKKFLEKHPLKITQFNRQNQTQWLNSIAMMKTKTQIRMGPGGVGGPAQHNSNIMSSLLSGPHHQQITSNTNNLNQQQPSNVLEKNQINLSHHGCLPGNQILPDGGGPSPLDSFSSSNNNPSNESNQDQNDLQWDSDSHLNLDSISNGGGDANVPPTGGANSNNNSGNLLSVSGDLDIENLVPDSSPLRSGPNSGNNSATNSNTHQQSPNHSSQLSSISPLNMQPSLQGVKVPDEVLTPQQRQHREESLATIRKMQQMFFPEQGNILNDCLIDDNRQNLLNKMVIDNIGTSQGNGGATGSGGNGGNSNNNGSGIPINNQLNLSQPGNIIQQQNQHQINNSGINPNMPGSLGNMMSTSVGLNQIKNMPIGNPTAGHNRYMLRPLSHDMSQCGVAGNNDQSGMNEISRLIHPGPGGQHSQTNHILGSGSGHGGMIVPGGGPPSHINLQQQQQILNQMNQCAVLNKQHPGNMLQQGGPQPIMNHNNSMSAQMEWTKLQHQFYENKGKIDLGQVGNIGNLGLNFQNQLMNQSRQIPPPIRSNSGPRSQGPPPPYHQTPRSASVPIAIQSPNPSSPNNPTSNLSLPSPRGTSGGSGSTLSSPADLSSRQQQQTFKHLTSQAGQSPTTSQDSPVPHRSHNHNSNPGTPLSSHMSPNANIKDFDSNVNQQGNLVKEPNLMPVPSPQQIQYLNTFEGQELTIQKQPNTSIKDSQQISSSSGGVNGCISDRLSGPNTPLTPSSLDGRFSSTTPSGLNSGVPAFPMPSSPQTPTPGSGGTPNSLDEKNRIQQPITPATSSNHVNNSNNTTVSSASATNQSLNSRLLTISQNTSNQGHNSSQNDPTSNLDNPLRFSSVSPGINFSSSGSTTPCSSGQPQTGPTGGMKMGNFLDISSNNNNSGLIKTNNQHKQQHQQQQDGGGGSSFQPCGRAENLPLNPNSNVVAGPKPSHFDPISSLAQMSQQLTSNVTGNMNGQQGSIGVSGGGGSGIMGGYGNHGMLGNDLVGMIGGGHGHEGIMGGMECNLGGMSGMLGPGQYGSPTAMLNQNSVTGMVLGGGPRSLSPKLGGGFGPNGPRLLSRSQMGGPFNGANIQVKPSAPNTIQYLPTRPQIGGNQQSRPPSLEFLHRFTNPMNNPMDVKMSNQNLQFYSNCNQMNLGVHHLDGSLGMGGNNGLNDHPMGLGMGGNSGGLPPHMFGQNMMMRGLRPQHQNQMMRMPIPPGHLIGNHYNGPPNGQNPTEPMFSGGGPQNPQMFVTGSKGSPIINSNPNDNQQQMGGPNNNQSNHGGGLSGNPSISGPSNNSNSNFKSQFVGPSTTDPNYAQQFHNFQQQLYATNTRSQLSQQGGQGMPNSINPNQSFFVQK